MKYYNVTVVPAIKRISFAFRMRNLSCLFTHNTSVHACLLEETLNMILKQIITMAARDIYVIYTGT